ncbi:MAG: cysteine synthase A [Acidobacteria bacterium]|nr:cysteine synthase A [Acidobacteriota bacterium]
MKLRATGDMLELIGNTPLLHLKNLTAATEGDVYGKLEFFNPGGSVKDRAALGMVLAAEKDGRLKPGSTLIEPTAGNTGIGLALVAIARGYKCIICMPQRFSVEKRILMKALGCELILTPDSVGMQGAIRKAQEIVEKTPNAFMPQQFENAANPDFHYQTTAREIWEQMEERVDAVVIGVGTGGTLSGVARFMKEKDRNILTVAVEPQGSVLGGGPPGEHRVEGIGTHFIPKNYDSQYVDEVHMVQDRDAFRMVRLLARREGLLVGSSSGAAAFAAVRYAKKLGPRKRVVTVLPDGSERYLSTHIYDEAETQNLKPET